MINEMPEGSKRVQDFLLSKGADIEVLILPESTATAQQAADAVGVPVYSIGKSIVFGNEQVTVVAVLCGDDRVDSEVLAAYLNSGKLKSLDADGVKLRTGFRIGGVSPFALPSGVKIVIEKRLYDLENCCVAAGHPKAVAKTSGKEIVNITGALVAEFANSQHR